MSGAIVALCLALMGAYLALDRRVSALAATQLDALEVEHIVDLKTEHKLDEIIRRLQHIDTQIDRMQHNTHTKEK